MDVRENIKTYEQQIRNKTIDEFAEYIKTSQQAYVWCCRDMHLEHCDGYGCESCMKKFRETIDEMADQMKKGGK